MARYKRDKNGRFAGSVGSGKTKTPTAAPKRPGTPKPPALKAAASSVVVPTPLEFDAMPAAQTAKVPVEPSPVSSASGQMTLPLRSVGRGYDIVVAEGGGASGQFVQMYIRGSAYQATLFQPANEDTWEVFIEAAVHGGEADLVSKSFLTKEEADDWARGELQSRQEEADLFDKRRSSNPAALSKAIRAHVTGVGSDLTVIKDMPSGNVTYVYLDRDADVTAVEPDVFEVRVCELASGGYDTLHVRRFTDRAYAMDFAQAMVLLGGRF